jgi:MFS family permease
MSPIQDQPADTLSATTSKKLFIIGSLYLGIFLVALDTTKIGTALPAITTRSHALDDLAWYGSAYLLTLTAFQPTSRKLYRVTEIKRLCLASILMFESMLPPCASSIP